MNIVINKLQSITAHIAQRSEVIVIFVVIGIIFMMILPLPTGLVDALIALNISVSALMVVMSMYMPGPLAFSTFPALLLVTTLFRMGLSITTTRLILLQGDAGSIVEAFGSFVVGGNLVVGVVIFLILTLVNFLVITKGSERVAEVSARFTLDAMPGKQMSIDSDLRAGLINAEAAQKKRANVGRESQLFGAMDGAMKFVKGDAIAGIIIVMVNILGGFSIGVMQLGLPAGEAIKIYAILTIGDGLVAQIPALLISLTAGMIITRVSDTSAAVSNIGQDMAAELSSEPKAWVIAAFVMLGFAMIPGMPTLAFITFAIIFGACGGFQIYVKGRNQIEEPQAMDPAQVAANKIESDKAESLSYQNGEQDLRAFIPYEKLCFVTHPAARTNPTRNATINAIRRARNKIVSDKGYTLPSIEITEDIFLKPDSYCLTFYGVPRLKGSFTQNRIAVFVEDMPKELQLSLGDQCKRGHVDYSEENIFWLSPSCAESLNQASVPFLDNISLITKRADDILRREGYQFIGIEETTKIMTWLNTDFPALSQELQRNIPMAKMSEILQHLAMENVSIRSVRKVAEIVAEKSTVERSIHSLIDAVRLELRDQICNELSTNNTLNICLLDQDAEEILRGSIRQTSRGEFLTLSEEDNRSLMEAITKETKNNHGQHTILVVAHDIRRALRELIKNDLFHVPVLSYPELTESLNVVPVARISI